MATRTQTTMGGKAARARAARKGLKVVTDLSNHRPSGGAPIASDLEDISSKCFHIAMALEEVEKTARMKFRPHLKDRKEVPMDNHGSMIVPAESSHQHQQEKEIVLKKNGEHIDGFRCDLSEKNLRDFSLDLLALECIPLLSIVHLDLSRNELWTLPSLQSIPNVEHLDLSRNWLAELPRSLGDLTNLKTLNASHNMLRSSRATLLIDHSDEIIEGSDNDNCKSGITRSILQSLQHLQEIDIRFNQKWGRLKLKQRIQEELPAVHIKMTINFPRPEGAFVGASAAERDPSLLRSQLEPWTTTSLRRRLVADFGDKASSPEQFSRADIMDRLLELYEEEAEGTDSVRTMVRASGTLVDKSLMDRLLIILKGWKDEWTGKNLERTSIRADNYMILTSPESWHPLGRKKLQKAEAKLDAHREIWDMAKAVMASVDNEFASKYTALAVTHNFQGSPHIDRQNVGPFYGLSLGDFDDGTGGVMVECSARVVAHVNTKNRLGKVDGRFPHWVSSFCTVLIYASVFYLAASKILIFLLILCGTRTHAFFCA
jgi:hypothetical protein